MKKNPRTKPLPKAGGSKTALNPTFLDRFYNQNNSDASIYSESTSGEKMKIFNYCKNNLALYN